MASGSRFIFRAGLEQADNTDSPGKGEIQLWPKRKEDGIGERKRFVAKNS